MAMEEDQNNQKVHQAAKIEVTQDSQNCQYKGR